MRMINEIMSKVIVIKPIIFFNDDKRIENFFFFRYSTSCSLASVKLNLYSIYGHVDLLLKGKFIFMYGKVILSGELICLRFGCLWLEILIGWSIFHSNFQKLATASENSNILSNLQRLSKFQKVFVKFKK